MAMTIRATFKKELSVKDNWRLFIASVQKENGRLEDEKFAGVFTPIYEGQPFLFTGEYKDYKGATTFNVKTYAAEMPKGEAETVAFIRSVKGIGKKRGEIISKYCDGDLMKLKPQDEEPLSQQCSGLKKESITKLIERVQDFKRLGELHKEYGCVLSIEELSEILARFGYNTERVLSYHPYWTDSIVGFTKADALGKHNRVKPNDIERVSSAVKVTLNGLCHKYNSAMVEARELIQSVLNRLAQTELGLVAEQDVHTALNKMLKDKKIAHNTCPNAGNKLGYVYPRKNWEYEQSVAEFIVNEPGKMCVEHVCTFQTAFANWCSTHTELKLSAQQTGAVWFAGTNRVSVITGGPGTGKTTVLKAIIETYEEAFPNLPITLMAPTGLAAKRMAEKAERGARTIHSTFKLIPVDDNKKDEFGSDYNDMTIESVKDGLVIIDEFSMVGLDISAFIVQHMSFARKDMQVVFVGDADQLPPISSGSVLQAMIDSKMIPVTRLDINFRQANDSHIPELAKSINSGNASDIEFVGGCKFIPCSNPDVCNQVVLQYIDAINCYGIRNVLVLAPMRVESEYSGPVYTANLNKLLRDAANPASAQKKEIKVGDGKVYRLGDRVINLKNTEVAVNGDIGTVTAVSDDSLTVTMDCGTVIPYDKKKVSSSLDLAYAVTVHKAQGGEFDAVIMPFAERQNFMLTRKLVYTAITRAKHEFIGVGCKNLLMQSATNVPPPTRPRDLLIPRIKGLYKNKKQSAA